MDFGIDPITTPDGNLMDFSKMLPREAYATLHRTIIRFPSFRQNFYPPIVKNLMYCHWRDRLGMIESLQVLRFSELFKLQFPVRDCYCVLIIPVPETLLILLLFDRFAKITG